MLKTFSITDIGRKRKVNQDYIYTSEEPVGNLPNVFIVADGMGGHNAGDYASKVTVETMLAEMQSSFEKNPTLIFRRAIEEANEVIRRRADEDKKLEGMGTTVVAATISNQMMYFANVGDSRLYLINQGIQQLTKDHSLVEEMVRLGGDHDAVRSEHIFRPIHALVRGKARMVAEHVVRRNALADGVVLHGQYLVVRRRAVVAAHDDLGCGAREVERDAVVQAILQDA